MESSLYLACKEQEVETAWNRRVGNGSESAISELYPNPHCPTQRAGTSACSLPSVCNLNVSYMYVHVGKMCKAEPTANVSGLYKRVLSVPYTYARKYMLSAGKRLEVAVVHDCGIATFWVTSPKPHKKASITESISTALRQPSRLQRSGFFYLTCAVSTT